MVCLDTTFLIDAINHDSHALAKLRALKGQLLCTTTISVTEIYRGAWNSVDKEREKSKVERFLDNLKIISFDYMSASIYADLYCKLKSSMIKDADLLIASMVISNAEVLLTRDNHFSRISGLKCDSW
jgi:tRNA(fMet)-specific endonuclease VapC